MIMANARCCTQKSIQHCKAIFLQLKSKLTKKDVCVQNGILLVHKKE